MSEVVKTFVLGEEKIPDWFAELCNTGRAKLILDEGELVGAMIYGTSGVKNVKLGQIIMLGKTGAFCLTKDQAKRFGVIGHVKKENN